MAVKRFIRTLVGTDWPEPKSGFIATLKAKVFRIFSANPDYYGELHRVSEWLIEFDQDGCPNREIGLNKENIVVIAGPDDLNYGFWLDTNMKLWDFPGEPVTEELFEECWNNAVHSGILNSAI